QHYAITRPDQRAPACHQPRYCSSVFGIGESNALKAECRVLRTLLCGVEQHVHDRGGHRPKRSLSGGVTAGERIHFSAAFAALRAANARSVASQTVVRRGSRPSCTMGSWLSMWPYCPL